MGDKLHPTARSKSYSAKLYLSKKKETGGGTKAGFKPRDKDTDDYIPKEVLDAARKAGGDKGGKYVNYLLSGQKESVWINVLLKVLT
jgi:hypothetical protein